MKYFLGIIAVIILLVLLIKNFLLVIAGGFVYGAYVKWSKSKQSGVKSKAPLILGIVGMLFLFGWIGQITSTSDESLQQASPTPSSKPVAATPSSSASPSPAPSASPSAKVDDKPVAVEDSLIVAKVTEVVDGDTVKVQIGDKEETVRLLLVDTPETRDPNEPVQPFGPEASKFAEKTLEGKAVKIEMDGPERDKYNRLLAYIWIGDKLFNQMLIEESLARVAYVYDPPYNHYDEFVAAEKKTKSSGKGIWSIDGYTTADGFKEEVAVASEEPSKEPSQEPVEEVYYANCAAVRAAGADPIREGDPGYSTKLDRDRDGIGCE